LSWISTRDACKRLGITLRTLYRLIDRGDLPAYKMGRVIRLRLDEVNAYAASVQIKPTAIERTAHMYTVQAVTESAERLRAFLNACNAGEPAPCLICSVEVSPADLPTHLLEHR
jgi:putative molybdopterin biosynthesis protein